MTDTHLAALRVRVAALEEEVDHYQSAVISMGTIMEDTVNALRGAPPDDCSWSTHDLAELAQKAAAVAYAALTREAHPEAFAVVLADWQKVVDETAREYNELVLMRDHPPVPVDTSDIPDLPGTRHCRTSDIPPRYVRQPEVSMIFVFGSNEAGRHGKGAALFARQHRGAVYGQGHGLQGSSYAIPTKDAHLRTLPLEIIAVYVGTFLAFAEACPELEFEVTPIGCGLAGYAPKDIAPLFRHAPPNCLLPKDFVSVLQQEPS